MTWLRRFFDVDESTVAGAARTSTTGLDLDAAHRFWSESDVTSRASQFCKPYRAVADPIAATDEARDGLPGGHLLLQPRLIAVSWASIAAVFSHQLPFRGSSVGRAFDC